MTESTPRLAMPERANRNGRAGSEFRDFAHIGPGTLAGRFMRTFWHPVYRSEDLQDRSVKRIRILGEDLTLYRGGSGAPHLVGDRCAHRRTQLSIGWVEGEHIRCFYHGWKYDAAGQCVEQPAEPKPFCKNVRIKSYPAREYLGMIFAFMGEGEPPPLPRYPDFETDAEALVLRVNYRGFNFFQDFENNMDRVHGGFVHRNQSNAFEGESDSPIVTAEEDSWGLKTHAKHPSGRYGVQSFGMPNKLHIMVTFEECERFIWVVPVDDQSTMHFNLSHYSSAQALQTYREQHAARPVESGHEPFRLAAEVVAGRLGFNEVNLPSPEKIWFEDDVVLLAQGVIADRHNECLGASDAPVILLRRIWEREMRALAEGRPLKQWSHAPEAAIQRA